MPDSLFDAMEQKYAPPEHPVFELVPPAFEIRVQHYYSALKLEAVGSKTFWNVYSALLHAFKSESGMDNLLSPVLAEVERSTHVDQLECDKIDMLPGLKPFRAGGKAVGDGGDGNDSDHSLYVDALTVSLPTGTQTKPNNPGMPALPKSRPTDNEMCDRVSTPTRRGTCR